MATAVSSLAIVNSAVTLGLELGAQIIPLIKGAVTSIKASLNKQGQVEYTVIITSDQAQLQDVVQLSLSDLAAINTELQKQGADPQPVPPAAT